MLFYLLFEQLLVGKDRSTKIRIDLYIRLKRIFIMLYIERWYIARALVLQNRRSIYLKTKLR